MYRLFFQSFNEYLTSENEVYLMRTPTVGDVSVNPIAGSTPAAVEAFTPILSTNSSVMH